MMGSKLQYQSVLAILVTIGWTVLANHSVAEGKNDPILSCVFEDGRDVTIAQRADHYQWLENGNAFATLVDDGQTSLAHKTIRAIHRIRQEGADETLAFYQKYATNQKPALPAGYAALYSPNVTDAGWEMAMVAGQCEVLIK